MTKDRKKIKQDKFHKVSSFRDR